MRPKGKQGLLLTMATTVGRQVFVAKKAHPRVCRQAVYLRERSPTQAIVSSVGQTATGEGATILSPSRHT